jgi:hypothetical protein
MSTKPRFLEGDRVMAQVSVPPIKAGMIGTITRVFITVGDLYDVQFDDLPHPYILHGYQLAPLQQADKPPS